MEPGRDDGFTLVELLMVVAVLGVMLLIAVPSFASAGDRAGRRAVEVDLHNAASAALLLASEAGGTFAVDGETLTPAHLHAEEPSLTFGDEPTARIIGVEVAPGDTELRLTKHDRRGQVVELLLDLSRVPESPPPGADAGPGDRPPAHGDGGSSGEHRRDGEVGRRSAGRG